MPFLLAEAGGESTVDLLCSLMRPTKGSVGRGDADAAHPPSGSNDQLGVGMHNRRRARKAACSFEMRSVVILFHE